MAKQGNGGRELVFLPEQLRAVEAASAALMGDLVIIRIAILRGPRLSRRDVKNLDRKLRRTRLLLAAAVTAYDEILAGIADRETRTR
jgi:hypothetical protein